MKLLLIGCEYAGTTTLAKGILRWGEAEMGAYFGLIHDHWKVPHVTGHWPIDTDAFPTAEERRDLVDLSPKFKEQMQRHSLYYHIQPGAFDKGKEEQQGFYPDYLAQDSRLFMALSEKTEMVSWGFDLSRSLSQGLESGLVSAFPYRLLVLAVFGTSWVMNKQIRGRNKGQSTHRQQEMIWTVWP